VKEIDVTNKAVHRPSIMLNSLFTWACLSGFWDVFQRWSQLPRLHSVGRRWTKHWLNDSDTGKPKCSEKTPSHCQFVYYRFPIYWPESEPGPRWWEASD
jgi:hypothetical protein